MGDNELFLIEFYYPIWHSKTGVGLTSIEGDPFKGGVMFNFSQETRDIFDGNLFHHAMLVSINSKGEINWYNAFKSEYKMLFDDSDEKIVMAKQDSSIALIMNTTSSINTMLIDLNGKTVETQSEKTLDIDNQNKTIQSTGLGHAKHCYNQYFININYRRVKGSTPNKYTVIHTISKLMLHR